ncbi:unnamed protein product [Lactuca saligna]|uniref:Uncharacterized protein n=1 Tax=Lactuca saligna TaxID=75948 RepID=A0AA36EFU1_LACSI|nr:unnamed protein product [Lactuca saligna]
MASYLSHFSLLQTISLFYFLVTLICSGSSLTHDEECSTLYLCKQSLIHQDDEFCATGWFQTFQSWKPRSIASDAGFDCCSWYDEHDGVLIKVKFRQIGQLQVLTAHHESVRRFWLEGKNMAATVAPKKIDATPVTLGMEANNDEWVNPHEINPHILLFSYLSLHPSLSP